MVSSILRESAQVQEYPGYSDTHEKKLFLKIESHFALTARNRIGCNQWQVLESDSGGGDAGLHHQVYERAKWCNPSCAWAEAACCFLTV